MIGEHDDDYDGGWEELQESDDFGEWLVDDDSYDPELNGSEYYDELLADHDESPEDDWDSVGGLPTSDLPPGALRFGSAPTARRDTPADPEIWHLTHLYNFQLMCSEGTLAPTPWREFGVRPGLQELVGKRAVRPTELGPAVGECLPFYFTVATPFSYRVLTPGWRALLVEPGGTRLIETHPSHYVFLRSTIRRVVSGRHGDWMVTNGNAATLGTQAWRSTHDLHCVDWSAVTARWSPSNQVARQAELLVAREVPLEALTSVHAASQEAADRARSIAGPWAPLVVADPPLFARARGN